MEITTTNVAGLHTRLTCSLEEFRNSQKPLLLIHGAWCASWIFEESGWLSKFADAGFATCVIDLRGHGHSQVKKRFKDISIDDYVADIHEVMGELCPQSKKLRLVGHSMGGLIAQKVASTKDIAGVVLMSSPLPHALANISMSFAGRLWKYPEICFGASMSLRDEDIRSLVGNNMPRSIVESALRQLQEEPSRVIRQIGIWGLSVPRLTCPTLVIGGSNDLLLPKSTHRRLADYHDAELKIFDIGHAPMFEKSADTVFHHVVSWLNSKGP